MSESHEWTDGDQYLIGASEAGPTLVVNEGKPQIIVGRVYLRMAREILRLAAETEKLERDKRMALAAADRLAARVAELEDVVADQAEIEAQRDMALMQQDIFKSVTAPLLPLFRERAAAWESRDQRTVAAGCAPLGRPDTITLTAEFPVEALRSLTKEES